MNFYSSSVALLWVTAFRAVAPPPGSRQIVFRRPPRKAKTGIRPPPTSPRSAPVRT